MDFIEKQGIWNTTTTALTKLFFHPKGVHNNNNNMAKIQFGKNINEDGSYDIQKRIQQITSNDELFQEFQRRLRMRGAQGHSHVQQVLLNVLKEVETSMCTDESSSHSSSSDDKRAPQDALSDPKDKLVVNNSQIFIRKKSDTYNPVGIPFEGKMFEKERVGVCNDATLSNVQQQKRSIVPRGA